MRSGGGAAPPLEKGGSVRRHVLHFLLLGALLFAAARWWPSSDAPPAARPVIVAASADEADAEILLREALAHGFDRQDKVVRERLLRLGRDLHLAGADDEVALEREARALGLERSDPLIRRHLIDMMRLAAAKAAGTEMPSEDELRAYFDTTPDRFAAPPRLTLTHVYLSRDQRGAALEADAATLLDDLRHHAVAPADAATLGDAFVRGGRLRRVSEAMLARTFGPQFAAAVFALPEQAWSAPIESPYGLHLVYVEQRAAAAPPHFEAVRSRILHSLLRERAAERLRVHLVTVRARYDVRIGGGDDGAD